MKNWIKIIKLCVLAVTVAGIMGVSGSEKISAGINACTHEGGGRWEGAPGPDVNSWTDSHQVYVYMLDDGVSLPYSCEYTTRVHEVAYVCNICGTAIDRGYSYTEYHNLNKCPKYRTYTYYLSK